MERATRPRHTGQTATVSMHNLSADVMQTGESSSYELKQKIHLPRVREDRLELAARRTWKFGQLGYFKRFLKTILFTCYLLTVTCDAMIFWNICR